MGTRTPEECKIIRDCISQQYFSDEPIDRNDNITELKYCCDKTCDKYITRKRKLLEKGNIPLEDEKEHVMIQFNQLDSMNYFLVPARNWRMEFITNAIYSAYNETSVSYVNTVLVRNGVVVDEIDPSVFPKHDTLLSFDVFVPKDCDLIIVGSLSMRNGKHLCCPVKFTKHCG